MARPSDADSAETYDRIVTASLAELETADVPSFSMRAVAQRAGLTVGAIQYYFHSKDALLEACLDGYYRRLDDLVSALLAAEATPWSEPVIARAAAVLFRFAHAERTSIRLRIAINTNVGRLPEDRTDALFGRFVRRLAVAVAGDAPDAVDDAAVRIFSLGVAVSRLALLTDEELEALVGVGGKPGFQRVEAHVARMAVATLDGQ